MVWKVQNRVFCKICRARITKPRSRTFCSKKCRIASYTLKYREQRSKWQRDKVDEQARKPDPNKVKCLVCGRYYVQVGTHIIQHHEITAREYREKFELPVKRGIVPKWYRKVKAEQAIESGGARNLKVGKRYWYVKGDKRARKNTHYKGRAAEVKRLPQEVYPHN